MALRKSDRERSSSPGDSKWDERAGGENDPLLSDAAGHETTDNPEESEPETGQTDPDENFSENRNSDDQETQPAGKSGVYKDMATQALHPGQLHPGQLHAPTQVVPTAVRQELVNAARVSDWSQLTDAEIMLRVRQGDDIGFNYLISKYQRQIVHFMFRMVHNQAVAEELAQEVFLRVYRSRETYRAEARFSTWLYRIATNLGVNHARDTKHERAAQNVYLDQPDPETGSTPDVADATPNVEFELLRDERLRAIRAHVLELPERQRTAVLMHKYQGMDYKQIGEVLKLSESATKSLLFRAYQTLRESLKDFV
jgi:RNA polymerase sigma-70 factor (ECF subfamily)